MMELRDHTIMRFICDFYGVTEMQVMSNDRHRQVAKARHMVMYFLRKLTYPNSYDYIGKILKRRHCDVLYAVKKIEGYLDVYPEFKREVGWLEDKLTELQSYEVHCFYEPDYYLT